MGPTADHAGFLSSHVSHVVWPLATFLSRGFVSWSALGGFVQYLAGRASDVCCFYVCIFPVVSISLDFEKTLISKQGPSQAQDRSWEFHRGLARAWAQVMSHHLRPASVGDGNRKLGLGSSQALVPGICAECGREAQRPPPCLSFHTIGVFP